MDYKKALISLLIVSACSENKQNFGELPKIIKPIASDFNPFTLEELGVPFQVDQLLEYSSFQIGYSYQFKQALWSGYVLQPELVRVMNDRVDSFKEELLLPIQYRATLNDYKNSGFHRGHLAPNATLDHTELSMSETFYLSNITAQHAAFNLNDWRQLETYVRDCVEQYADQDRVFVFTGPYFDGVLQTIGDSNIPVATGFYKVIYEFNHGTASALAFIAPHNDFDYANLNDYLRSIDFIEKITHLDFAINLPQDLEVALESNVSPVCDIPADL